MTVVEALQRLEKSKFRSSFHLNEKDIEYINKIGYSKLEEHAYDFVNARLRNLNPNDGKQTPMKGHPIFKAMHGCGCCCRGCLYKWYKVDKKIQLNDKQIKQIVNLLMAWIKKEVASAS